MGSKWTNKKGGKVFRTGPNSTKKRSKLASVLNLLFYWQVVCPVCREPITFDLAALASSPPPALHQETITLSEDMKILQRKMSRLFEKQKAKGGIIDVEAEKNKYYLTLVIIYIETSNH